MKVRNIARFLCVCMAFLLLLPAAGLAAQLTVDADVGEMQTPAVNAAFRLYRVADVDFNCEGVFTWIQPFDQVALGNSNITQYTSSQWQELAETFEGIVEEKSVAPTYQSKTDSTGTIVFDIPDGLYLITAPKYVADSQTYYLFQPSLVCLPQYSELDPSQMIDQVTIRPKSSPFTSGELSVVKVWQDGGAATSRPESIQVELLCDDTVVETVTLNSANRWTYKWHELDPEKNWTVREKVVPTGYTMSSSTEGTVVTITNKYKPTGTLPQTGQLWWPVPILLIAGLTCFIVGWSGRKCENANETKE